MNILTVYIGGAFLLEFGPSFTLCSILYVILVVLNYAELTQLLNTQIELCKSQKLKIWEWITLRYIMNLTLVLATCYLLLEIVKTFSK